MSLDLLELQPLEPPPSQTLLTACRGLAGAPPRDPGRLRIGRRDLAPRKPAWCGRSEPLRNCYDLYTQNWIHGEVVWARIVQANNLVFAPGDEDLPGLVLCDADPASEIDLDTLSRAAADTFRLRKKPGAPGIAGEIARHLNNEMSRPFGLPAPPEFCRGRSLLLTSIMLIRAHFPVPYLASPIFPVLLHQREPRFAAVLPSEFWPEALIRWWLDPEAPAGHKYSRDQE